MKRPTGTTSGRYSLKSNPVTLEIKNVGLVELVECEDGHVLALFDKRHVQNRDCFLAEPLCRVDLLVLAEAIAPTGCCENIGEETELPEEWILAVAQQHEESYSQAERERLARKLILEAAYLR